MRDLRVVFMGTPLFAVTILNELLKNNINVVGVITAPDKPAGRGRKLNQSDVKKYALKNNLKVLQPKNLKNSDFQKELKLLNPNLQIVVAFRMLPEAVWKIPKYGTFNLHASLLPAYRGAAPINWAIINGETKTGVTTFFIDEKIDTGEIILQDEIQISSTETVGELHDKLMNLGAKLVIKTVNLIKANKTLTKKQPEKEKKQAPKLNPENCRINWQNSLDNIYNMIRGLNPYPAAWTILQNGNEEITVKIYDVRKEKCNSDFPLGKVVFSKKNLKISTLDGFLIIDSLKLAGKRKMDSISLLNGFKFHSNALMF